MLPQLIKNGACKSFRFYCWKLHPFKSFIHSCDIELCARMFKPTNLLHYICQQCWNYLPFFSSIYLLNECCGNALVKFQKDRIHYYSHLSCLPKTHLQPYELTVNLDSNYWAKIVIAALISAARYNLIMFDLNFWNELILCMFNLAIRWCLSIRRNKWL